MELESYIKDLSPELQEKARACGSVEELLALAREAKVPIPDEVLEAIAGGEDIEDGSCMDIACPKCGSKDVTTRGMHHKCNRCGYKWMDNVF